jgi:hypothetical protein
MKITVLKIIAFSAMLGAATARAGDLAAETYNTTVSKTGEIRLPDKCRQNWTHLGSWAVNDAKAPGYGFHDVYTQPEAVKAFLETGQFPDGAVLIKEIRKIGSGVLTTGPALWAADNAVWFVMVKDTKKTVSKKIPTGAKVGDGRCLRPKTAKSTHPKAMGKAAFPAMYRQNKPTGYISRATPPSDHTKQTGEQSCPKKMQSNDAWTINVKAPKTGVCGGLTLLKEPGDRYGKITARMEPPGNIFPTIKHVQEPIAGTKMVWEASATSSNSFVLR